MEIGDLKVEQAEGVGTVNDDFDVVGVSHIGDLPHGHYLANPVNDMRNVNDAGAWRDGLLVGTDDRVLVLNGEIKANLLEYNSVAFGSLPIPLDHVRIVLLGADDFIAGFERQSVDDGVERFGGVAVNCDFTG